MNDVVSLPTIAEASSRVLSAALVPLHYREVTDRALALLGRSKESVNYRRQIEDVREHVLLAGQRGLGYTGSPLCAGFRRSWFKTAQLELMQVDAVRIQGNVESGISGAFNSVMRFPHIENKYGSSEE